LAPQKIIAFNGTWKNIIHYQDFWWEAYDLDVKIEKLSPFLDEKDAQEFAKKLTDKMERDFDKKWPKDKEYEVKELHQMLDELSHLSWDWTGRVSAIITQKASDGKYKIITRSYNTVVPYPSYMLHEGSLREKNHSEIGSNIELEETVHAETNCLSQLSNQKVSLENAQIWVQTFPCPCCARLIARSPIIEVKYFNEYTNPLGYELLEKAGKKIKNIRE
jgi:deoxycytidylate deaminase